MGKAARLKVLLSGMFRVSEEERKRVTFELFGEKGLKVCDVL